MAEYILLHERVALAHFESQDKARKFLKKILKEKAWLNNHGIYKIVEVKENFRKLH